MPHCSQNQSAASLGQRDEPRPRFVPPAWSAKFERDLEASFRAAPVESGVAHLADRIVEDALRVVPGELVYDFLGEYFRNAESPSFAADALRCLTRLARPATAEWRARIVREALASADQEIRGCAIQAAESWEDSGLAEILRAHEEPKAYLREYLQDVLAGLPPSQ